MRAVKTKAVTLTITLYGLNLRRCATWKDVSKELKIYISKYSAQTKDCGGVQMLMDGIEDVRRFCRFYLILG